MELLVSVASAADAAEALAGGAHIVDAKDPANGALGAVSLQTLRAIHAAVGQARPVTAALGDATSPRAVAEQAHDYAAAGAHFLKVGFAGIASARRVTQLAAAAVEGARRARAACGIVAVAYADADRAASLDADAILAAAAAAGTAGVLLDTFDKRRGGLLTLMSPDQLASWVAAAHDARLHAALAGRLTDADLPNVASTGADIAGVRGAACVGGRNGRVSRARVARLRVCVEHEAAARLTPALR